MEPDRQSPDQPHIRRWDATTKVVIAVILIVLAGLALYLFRVVIVPLIIGAIMAYVLTPLVRAAHQKLRMPWGLATAIIYLVLLAVVIPLPASLIPWAVARIGFLRHELINFMRYLDTISTTTVQVLGFEVIVGDIVNEVTSQLTTALTSVAPQSLTLVFSAAETVLLVIFTFLIGFYLTRDAEGFRSWASGLIPPAYRDDARGLIKEIDTIWSAFFRGQVILALVVTVLLTGVSAVLGLPQPLLMGVLGGLMEFLPSVGHAVWLVTAGILALVEGSSTLPVSNVVFLLIVIGVHIAYTQFDLNYLIPRIIGQQVHLHPMVVILGIIVGASVGGVLGVALAAPTIASLRVVGRYVYARLFDMDPFPMVGPPSAPREVRQQHADQLAARRMSPAMTKGTVRKMRDRAWRAMSGRRRSDSDQSPTE